MGSIDIHNLIQIKLLESFSQFSTGSPANVQLIITMENIYIEEYLE